MTRKHSRECKKNWQADGDEKYSTVIKSEDEEEDDYVMVDKPREPLSGAWNLVFAFLLTDDESAV